MRRMIRNVAVAATLALTALVVPNGAVNSTDATLVKVQRAHAVDLSPDVIWILALGSDARPGQNVTRSRADAIQLVGINTRTGAATSIGIPRDSWVSIPGHGSNRINTGLYYGGPQLMARAVEGLTGVEADYVMVASFWGLRQMVDAIGGVSVDSRHAFSDPYLRPRGFRVGRQHLNGMGALAFSRVRKSLPRGDFDRSANQQETLRAIQEQVHRRAAEPGFLDRGALAVLKHMDAQVAPKELFKIARAVAAVRSDRITRCVVNGSIGNIGGASVVLPFTAQARRYGNDARRDAVISRC
ncbi:LCP family protein [Nocardioides sp. JQ2195]|uniref:LCP family protein n=1 Tax=Nocardioides sp. JQ2195 TaxID=2592334 RepID=UPI00143E2B67|nr:LCP family protein [Nocardioides sp. JQ2195]QIX27453.1 LCP family protein [Nocardioides sp. JQ2195]